MKNNNFIPDTERNDFKVMLLNYYMKNINITIVHLLRALVRLKSLWCIQIHCISLCIQANYS